MPKFNVTCNEEHAIIVEASNKDEAKEKAMNGFGTDDSAKVSDLQAYNIEKDICEGCGEPLLEGQATIKGKKRHSACS